MAVIHFEPSDALQTKVVEAGAYPCEVTKIEGPLKSSTGKSFSYFVDVSISDGPYKGKIRTLAFNTGTSSPSLLGEMQFYPNAYFLQLNAAINDIVVEPKSVDLDTDELLNKPFVATWGVALNEGHPINVINAFHPARALKELQNVPF